MQYKAERRQRYAPYNARNAKQRNWALRLEVIAAYGGACRCCGESTPEFLSIDHIGGQGRNQARQLFGQSIGGTRFYRWLKQQGYPRDGLQLLCLNCNCAKHERGDCPHLGDDPRPPRPVGRAVSTAYQREWKRWSGWVTKRRALAAYGATCTCCGEVFAPLLTFDHVAGDGAAQRRDRAHPKGGLPLHKWLADQPKRDDFQILCFNCNGAKGFFGRCPHRST